MLVTELEDASQRRLLLWGVLLLLVNVSTVILAIWLQVAETNREAILKILTSKYVWFCSTGGESLPLPGAAHRAACIASTSMVPRIERILARAIASTAIAPAVMAAVETSFILFNALSTFAALLGAISYGP